MTRAAILLVSTAALLGAWGVARAQDAVPLPVVSIDRELYAAVDGMWMDYDEHLPAGSPEHDRERGWTPGFGVGGRWMGNVFGLSDVFAALDYRRQSGNLHYTGTLFGTGVPVAEPVGMVTDDVTGELGHGFLLTPSLMLIPALQLGYHDWHRDLSQDEAEDYHHVFIGAAIRANYAFTPRLVGTLRLGVSDTLDPQVDVHFQGDTQLGLGSDAQYQAGGKLDYALTSQVHLFAAGDVTRFEYGRSGDAALGDQSIYEPASTTTTVIVSTGVAYGF